MIFSNHLGLFSNIIAIILIGGSMNTVAIRRVEAVSTTLFSSSPLSNDQLSSKYFRVKPSDVYVIEGESAELKCQINADTDAGPVQWAKDGFLLGKFLACLLSLVSLILYFLMSNNCKWGEN